MSQDVFSTVDPSISGTALAGILNDFKDALMTGLSGTSRPAELDQGGGWVDVTNDPTTWSYKIWTGTADVEVFRINLSTGIASVALAVEDFSVKKVTADTAGAILKLVKQRLANNGQVLDGDTVGEVQFIGRASDASNPVVAKLVFVASDDQTSSAFGGEFQFWSTADNSNTLTKHMRFINGIIETILPLKINSLRLGSQSVATSATIAQLSALYGLVEMTGSTATDLQGINSAAETKVITIHNRSSANITLKHQSGSASANDRLKLPGSLDYLVVPDASVTLYYCTTDSRWKLKSTAEKNFFGFTVETFYGAQNTWTAPSSVSSARVRAYRRYPGMRDEVTGLIDMFGGAYAWGLNNNGQLGIGSVTAASSPVAVSGGLTFLRVWGSTDSTSGYRIGLEKSGALYGWGANPSGLLGTNDTTPRSTPVAVAGGFRFNWVYPRYGMTLGLSTGNMLLAWGVNTNGQLGDGSVTSRSTPTAVFGSLRFAKAVPLMGSATSHSVVALTTGGAAYAWGVNTNGNLGVADVIPRSTPTAVTGGIVFNDVGGGSVSARHYFLGVNTSGIMYAWGNNDRGQLGLGDTTPRSSPVAVLGSLAVKRIFTHEKSESAFALNTAGVLYAWGENAQGQLGVGDITARSSPVAVLGGFTFTKIRHYRNSTFGLTADGTLYAWGQNDHGQLGLGDVTNRSSPIAVLGGFKFHDVAFGDGPTDAYSVFGVRADGSVYAWGRNINGSLGLGDVTPRSSPVAVVGAYRADTKESTFSASLTVTPSAAYPISLTSGISSFGNVSLGEAIYKVEVEYLQ